MLNRPTITAHCNTCRVESPRIEMYRFPGGGWDESCVADQLRRMGWKFDGLTFTCPGCAAKGGRRG